MAGSSGPLLLCPRRQAGLGADHGDRGADMFEMGSSPTHNRQSFYLPFCGDGISVCLWGPSLPHFQLALPQGFRNMPDQCWPVRAWHWPTEGHAA